MEKNVIVANTRFKSNSYVNFKSFNVGGNINQIDHVIVNKHMMTMIENCKVVKVVSAHVCHSTIETIMRIKAPNKIQKYRRKIN